MKELEAIQDRPVVAHINKQYFARSETFMYFYLSHLRRVHPICLSWGPFVNTDLFPFPPSDCYAVGVKPYALRRLWPEVWQRLTRQRVLVERILQRRRARLIHAHYGPVGWWALPLKRALQIPLVTNFYGYDMAPELTEEGPDWPRRRQELFNEGDLFLVEGPFMQQRLIELGCPPEKIQIQRIAIKVREMPFRTRKPRADGKVVILFAGRFYEKKGLLYALQAVRDVWRSGRNMEFRIIGDGPLAPQVRTFVKEQGLEGCVRVSGFLNYQDYLQEMQGADIFLHPSVTTADGDSEGGAPTTILEAQALGMPVVSTYHADIPHVVVPGKSALLVPERDSEALSRALIYLLDHPESWENMGRAGRAYMEMNHDIDCEGPTLEEKYFALLSLG